MEPMNTTRELTVLGPKGTPLLDMDPADVANNGDVASAWDTRLHDVLASMTTYTGRFDVPLTLVWSDTNRPVMIECPACDAVTFATTYTLAEDDDCLICSSCQD